jgi:phenolic acid decarboxylase
MPRTMPNSIRNVFKQATFCKEFRWLKSSFPKWVVCCFEKIACQNRFGQYINLVSSYNNQNANYIKVLFKKK